LLDIWDRICYEGYADLQWEMGKGRYLCILYDFDIRGKSILRFLKISLASRIMI